MAGTGGRVGARSVDERGTDPAGAAPLPGWSVRHAAASPKAAALTGTGTGCGDWTVRTLFEQLLAEYGPQHWWPGNGPFEVMVGAVLTQNTAWTNAERGIQNLRRNRALDPEAILAAPRRQLADWIRPAGFYKVKAERLRGYCRWYLEQGGYAGLAGLGTADLRMALLGVKGIGPETADDILLYAFGRPVFVVDAYTRRIFSRLGLSSDRDNDASLKRMVEDAVESPAVWYGEYHALLVTHGKRHCRSTPACDGCGLGARCAFRTRAARSLDAGSE